MTKFKLIATVANSRNVEPIAVCETRSFTMAQATQRAWRKEGFAVAMAESSEFVGQTDHELRKQLGE